MAEPFKTQILTELKNRLQTIDGSTPYHYDFTVKEPNSHADDILSHEYPAILITEPNQVNYHFKSTDGMLSTGRKNRINDGWFPLVSVILKGDKSQEGLWKKFNYAEFDIVTAIGKDIQLNGTCDSAYPRIRKEYTPQDEDYVVLDLQLAVKYSFRPQSEEV